MTPYFQHVHSCCRNRSIDGRWRTKSYRFSHAKCLFTSTFEKNWNNRNVKFHLHFTCARPLLRVLQTEDFAYKPPSNKSRTWTEAAPKSWNMHKPRLLYTTLRYGLFSTNDYFWFFMTGKQTILQLEKQLPVHVLLRPMSVCLLSHVSRDHFKLLNNVM